MRADAMVETYGLSNDGDIGSDRICDRSDLVHERDPDTEMSVGGVLGEFGGLRRRHDHGSGRRRGSQSLAHGRGNRGKIPPDDRVIGFQEAACCRCVEGAHDDAVRYEEIGNGRPLREELRIRDDG